MAGFDRSKLKATALATAKKQEQEQQAKRPSSGFDRAGYLKIEDGDNTFRLFPYHPDGGGSTYAEAKCVSFLSVTRPKRDDQGKPVDGQTEVKRVPIFNSKVHGNLDKDLVETYLEVAKTIAIPNYIGEDNSEEFKRIWGAITGQNGVKPSDTWVVYASKKEGDSWGPVGLLELKKTIKTQLTDIAAAFSDDIQSPDPFTDPDDGIAIIINKSGKMLDTKYKVTMESEKVREKGKVTENYVITPLTDAQLEEWSKLDSLHKMYVNVFKASDLEAQVEGLQTFDQELATKHRAPISVFQYDELLNVIDELSDQVQPDKEEPKQEQQSTAKPAPKLVRKPVQQQSVEEQEIEEEQEAEEVEVVTESARPNRLVRKPPVVEQQSAPAVNDAKDRLAALKKKLGK